MGTKGIITSEPPSTSDKECFLTQVNNLYTTEKWQWLGASVAGVTLLYLTSEELWNMFNGKTLPEMSDVGLVVFSLFFALILSWVRYNEMVSTVTEDRGKCLAFTVTTLLIDLMFITSAEMVVTACIQTLPTNTKLIPGFLITGALPVCLGVGTIKRLSSSKLDKLRAKRIKLDKMNQALDEAFLKEEKVTEDEFKKLKELFKEWRD